MDEMEAAIGTDGTYANDETGRAARPNGPDAPQAHICHNARISATGISRLASSPG